MPQAIKDILASTRGIRPALPWMGFTALIVLCQWVERGNITDREWVKDLSKFITIGAITAIFTRFLGGMGMFRDAISDVMLDEKWINRRNDLEEVWGTITRHIFMPGFNSNVPEAKDLAEALRRTMSKSVLKPEQQVNYYAKNMVRRITISWEDRAQNKVRIKDVMTTTIIPFDEKNGCDYEMIFSPTSNESIDDYTVRTEYVSVDGQDRKIEDCTFVKSDNKSSAIIKLAGRDPRLSRAVTSIQSIESDPILVVCAGRVVWGMQAIIHVQADGLRINFEEVGVDKCFLPDPAVASPPSSSVTVQATPNCLPEMAYFTKDALLPDQGFMIVMAQMPPSLPPTVPPSNLTPEADAINGALTISGDHAEGAFT